MARKTPVSQDKQKALEAAFHQIQKQFGPGAVMRLGESSIQKVDIIPSGSLALDIALGIGGIPRGRVTEIYGAEASGKTTLALHLLASAQKLGGEVAFIDAEHALDPIYAERLGLDIDKLLVSQPSSGEQALEITEMLVRSNAIDVIVIDSVAALVPRAEIEGEMGDTHVGLQARLMSQALRKLTGAVSRSNCAVVFINQIRMKIGVMFGNPETTSGGRALKFYASVRLDVRRIASIKEGDEVVGSRTKVKVVKNKLAPPFRIIEFDLIHGKGISTEGELIDLGMEKELISRRGTWYSYGDRQIGQGKENARKFLLENADVAAELETRLRELYELPVLSGKEEKE
jgi:recombination protein RecA